MASPTDPPDPVTPESIARAKHDTALERARIKALTGVDFTDDGRFILPSPRPQLVQLPEEARTGDHGGSSLAQWALGVAVAQRLLAGR